jgi:HAE1 family hydrophobic/amphiphilic exporter-1
LRTIRNAVDGDQTHPADQVETEVITGRTDDIPVLLLAVASDASLDVASRQVENVVIPDLSGIDGVRSVTATGEDTTQLLVTLRPKDLRKHDVTAQAVTQTVQGQATVTPAGTSFDKNLELAVEVGTASTPSSSSRRCGADSRRSDQTVRGCRCQGGLDRVDLDCAS